MTEPLMLDLGILIATVTVFTVVGSWIGQPNVLSYIIAGIVLGPVLGAIENHLFIETLSKLGVSFLLFLVGLRIDLSELRDIGRTGFIVAAAQMIATGALTYLIAWWFGMGLLDAIYVAIAVTFSSTVVVVKILEEQEEMDKLYSRINVSVLLVQDIAVIFILAALSTLGPNIGLGFRTTSLRLLETTGLGIAIVGGTLIAARYVLPRMFSVFAESEESFLVASIGWFMVLITLSEAASLSLEIGGFLAGLSLAQLPYNQELKERVRPLTDVFVAFFFASLGLQLTMGAMQAVIIPALLLSVLVIAVKFVTIFVSLNRLRYSVQTSFMSAISLAQISEFSFILVGLGASLGHIGPETIALMTMTGLITIGTSSYFISYSKRLYDIFEPHITRLEPSNINELSFRPESMDEHVVLVGSHVQGHQILDNLEEEGEDVLVVDYNPHIIEHLLEHGHQAVYGDIGDLKARNDIKLHRAKLIVSTIPSVDDTKLIINKAKKHDVPCVVKAESIDTALELYDHGADYVIFPDMLSAQKVAGFIDDAMDDPSTLDDIREQHREKLQQEKVNKSRLYEVLNQ
ncbi:MAG: cation:proton antiporter [Candidatus Nanohaloarchaea archaeon]|nr:cation:proton antiporter [Candidatus Nanohaloarchaea archaeon]